MPNHTGKFRAESRVPAGGRARCLSLAGIERQNPMGTETATGRVLVEDHNFGASTGWRSHFHRFSFRGCWFSDKEPGITESLTRVK